MEITWYGLSCFKINERGAACVIINPLAGMRLPADIVAISSKEPDAAAVDDIPGTPYRVYGPGEYEVRDVFITGIQTSGKNTIYVFDYDSLTVAHLGNLTSVPTQAEREAMGTVQIALVPIGGALSAARAAEAISLIEPRIAIPMVSVVHGEHNALDVLSKFLKEMGLSEAKTLPSLKVSNASLPDETQVIVLDEQHP